MVCFEIDDYINDRDKTHWFVDLSNGTRIFADDDRPGLEPNAWKRLRDYLYANNLFITHFFIRFRSHVELIGSSEIGYFFRRGLMADIASGVNHDRFICGLLDDRGYINCQTWNTPEITRVESEDEQRNIEDNEESIIWNSSAMRGDHVPPNTF